MAANDIKSGSVIGGYQVEGVLGKGGMGVVYKAHELSLNRKVALKVLSQRLCADEEFITRFKREARVIAALEHPNIVRILSYGEEEDLHYYAMEYIAGKDLNRILKERSAIPLEEALDIAAQVADALIEADIRGVVHRDLKPANIMINEKGQVRITDFGIAYFKEADTGLTRTGFFLGTPEFASPEQASGARLDVRSDIYSLGAILYWMLAGKPPFTGDSPQAVLIKIATETLPPIQTINASVPEPVCDLIDKMTAKDPADRFQKPDKLLAAITACVSELTQPVSPVSPGDKKEEKKKKRNPVMSDAVTLGVILALILVIILVVWQGKSVYHKMTSDDQAVETQTAEVVMPIVRSNESAGQAETTVPQVPEEPSPEEQVLADDVEARSPKTPPAADNRDQDQIARQVSDPGPGQNQPDDPDGAVASVRQPARPVPGDAVLPPAAESRPVLRENPLVLIIASGDETMVPLLRANLSAIILQSGLKVTRIAEIPRLRERIQMGRVPITQYSIRQIVPRRKADIILLAQIQKTGTTNLEFYGQTQEMTTATFTVEAIDMAGGTALDAQAVGTANFSALNMVENIKVAVEEAAGDVGREIKRYWKDKLDKSKADG